MASKIPGFTSGLKPPTTSTSMLPSLAKRRGAEGVPSQPIEKRARNSDDSQGNLLFTCLASYDLCFIL